MGRTARAIPIVVILVLLGSLVEALMILPAHLARSGKKTNRTKGNQNVENHATHRLKRFIAGPYTRLLSFCIRWRYATIAFGIALLMWTVGVLQGGWLKFTFFPKVESDFITCSLTMPAGTPIEHTVEIVAYLDRQGHCFFRK